MKLTALTLAGVFAMASANEARQARASLFLQEVAENLYMLGNDPSGEGMRGGGNTAIFVMTSARCPRYFAFTAINLPTFRNCPMNNANDIRSSRPVVCPFLNRSYATFSKKPRYPLGMLCNYCYGSAVSRSKVFAKPLKVTVVAGRRSK